MRNINLSYDLDILTTIIYDKIDYLNNLIRIEQEKHSVLGNVIKASLLNEVERLEQRANFFLLSGAKNVILEKRM